MTKRELEKLEIETEHGIFTPLYTYEDCEDFIDEDGNLDFKFKGFKMIKSAQEVYKEWIDEINNPIQTLQSKEITIEELQRKIDALNAELQEIARSCNGNE